MTARRHRRPRLLRRPAAGIAGAGRPLAAAAILGLGLLIGGCGDLVQSDGQRSAERPGIANVRQLSATGSTRAEEYRATATALAAKSEASQPSEEKPAGKLGEIVHRLRMPPAERIQIPSLEIDAPVEEVSTTIQNGRLVWQVIDDIVGHHHASANPGEPGNIVLTGHVESRSGGDVFLELPDIEVGAEVILTSPAGEFRYVVASVEVHHESETSVLAHGYEEKLTLITCVNDGIFDHRVVVTAYPVQLTASR